MIERESAIIFPGQGSQEKGMGRDLAEVEVQAMELWRKAEKISGHPLREIFWDGTAEDMSRTEFLQPALTVVNLNLWFFFRNRLQARAMAGHSLGEYCALCSSGVLEAEQTLELVSLRGRLMADSGLDSPGTMGAVLKLELSKVEELAAKASQESGQTLVMANYNTAAQFVVSGHGAAVKVMEKMVSESGGRLVRLAVSGAFHSPLMAEAARELAGMMNRIHWKAPSCEVFFNSTSRPEYNPEKIKELMQKQMTSPVYFFQLINNISQKGLSSYIELGPKGILTRMVSQILGKDKKVTAVNISGINDRHKLKAADG